MLEVTGSSIANISIVDYCRYLENSDRKPASRVYWFSLKAFEDWLKSFGKSINDFTSSDFIQYMGILRNANTANLTRAAVKGYLKYRAGSLPLGDSSSLIENQRVSQISLIRNKRRERKFEKVALTPEETKKFLNNLGNSGIDPLIYHLAVVDAYCGARPIEIEEFLGEAKIKWKDNSMIIKTAKTGNERFLCWDDRITPHLKYIYDLLPLKYAGSHLTKGLHSWQKHNPRVKIPGLIVTSRVFRKTFQTNQRIIGTPDLYVDHVLGHVSKSSAIGDVYTSWDMLIPRIRELMTTDEHYMIRNGII